MLQDGPRDRPRRSLRIRVGGTVANDRRSSDEDVGRYAEIWADGFRFKDGFILPPEAPGLGGRLTDNMGNRFPIQPGSSEWSPVPGGKGDPL